MSVSSRMRQRVVREDQRFAVRVGLKNFYVGKSKETAEEVAARHLAECPDQPVRITTTLWTTIEVKA